jgi:catalase
VDRKLAERVAHGLGLEVPAEPQRPMNQGVPADADPQKYEPTEINNELKTSPALSMEHTVKNTIKSRMIAILATDGVNGEQLEKMRSALSEQGAVTKIIAPHGGTITDDSGNKLKVGHPLLNTSSVMFDAVYVPGGIKSVALLKNEPGAIHFINEAFKHCKAIAYSGEGSELVAASATPSHQPDEGLLSDPEPERFVKAIARHRFWQREKFTRIPA